MNRDILCRPFDPSQIKTRPGHNGKQVAYVDVAAVIARLNEGCDSWSFEVTSHKIEHEEVIVLGKLLADGVVKMAFGGSSITLDKDGRVISLADDLKAAASDALKKCASLLGVAAEIYGGAPAVTGEHNRQRESGTRPEERVSARQLAAIQSACRRQNIGREQLLAMIEQRTHKAGVQFLTKTEASALIDELSMANGTHA